MKSPALVVMLAAALIWPVESEASESEAGSAPKYLVCEFCERSLRITCWDSSRAAVYRAVPFDQVFSEGWRLMQAYSRGDINTWILGRSDKNCSN
jgi:hypothetical protein